MLIDLRVINLMQVEAQIIKVIRILHKQQGIKSKITVKPRLQSVWKVRADQWMIRRRISQDQIQAPQL